MQTQVAVLERPTIQLKTSFDARKSSDIERVISENLKVISVLADKEGMSNNEAKLLFSDTIKFLFLCSISEKPLAPNNRLDVGWHHFILNTKEYMNFCSNYCGEYIHHSPFTIQDKKEMKHNPVKETIEFAKSVFFELSENWYNHINAECCEGGSCSNTGNCSHCQSE